MTLLRTICVGFFRSDFKRNPKEIADSAGEKRGEKKAVDRSVWKRGAGGWRGRKGRKKSEAEGANAHDLWHVEQWMKFIPRAARDHR